MKKIFLCFIFIIFMITLSACIVPCEYHIDEDSDDICDVCKFDLTVHVPPSINPFMINTFSNVIIPLVERNDLNTLEFKELYDEYYYGIYEKYPEEYQIYNLIDEEYSTKYEIDVFEIRYEKNTYYYLKHKDDFYSICPFSMNNENNNCVSSIALTDINSDSHYEILSSVLGFSERKNYFYSSSFMKVYDSYSKDSIEMYGYDKAVYCFKENEDKVMSIYHTGIVLPDANDLVNGKLDDKYYDLASTLYETPTLNTTVYEFKETYIEEECSMYKVEVTFDEGNIKFPYIFENALSSIGFNVTVKMTYLGKTFSYTSPDGYLDGATATFVNGKNSIECEGWLATAVITKFVIYTGMEIEREYKYCKYDNKTNLSGTYDMIISYNGKDIKVKNFLKVYNLN